jgi:hypothetical protein
VGDRYGLEEKRLRYVLKVEDDTLQLRLVRYMIEKNLSAERIRQIVEAGNIEAWLDGEETGRAQSFPEEESASERVAKRWPSLASQFSKADLALVADQWVKREKPEEVRKQVAVLRRLLEIVEQRFDD